MNGFVHSVESFGTVDGPGIRFVIFMQGCPMRCLYCHNPDTWDINTGSVVTADDLLEKFNKNRSFYSNGGITVTGGEPLLQIDFLLELFEKAKKEGIHTCIDTSGVTFTSSGTEYRSKLDRLMEYTNLVMLDIKHINNEEHYRLTGHGNENILEFAEYLSEKNIPVWVRHVIVPGITDKEEYLRGLGAFIAGLKNVKALDVLPYHTMGVSKYKELNIEYPLEGVPSATKELALKSKNIILDSFRKTRKKSVQP